MVTAKRTQPQRIEDAANKLDDAAQTLADRSQALEDRSRALENRAAGIERNSNHQQVLIRWLYLIIFVVLVVGSGMIWFLDRVTDRVDSLKDQQNRIELLVDKVDDNNQILVDLQASLCAIAMTVADVPSDLPSCVQE